MERTMPDNAFLERLTDCISYLEPFFIRWPDAAR